MAYLRWSSSPWYVFEEATSSPKASLAIWPLCGCTASYNESEVRQLAEALNQWLEDLKDYEPYVPNPKYSGLTAAVLDAYKDEIFDSLLRPPIVFTVSDIAHAIADKLVEGEEE